MAAVVTEIARKWGLQIGPPFGGDEVACSWVAPVKLRDGSSAVLKLGVPHYEAEHELDGLLFWDGDPTVRVLRFDRDSGAMLLERCMPGTMLRDLAEPDQDIVIAGLLRRLWRSPSDPNPFRALSSLMEHWSRETLADRSRWHDAGLVREGLQLTAELPLTATREVMLATDLHAANVLRAARQEWLVIDPKPFIGDPAYDATQHLFNCERLHSNPKDLVRRMAGLLEIDHTRLQRWTFARAAAEPDRCASAEFRRIARILSA